MLLFNKNHGIMLLRQNKQNYGIIFILSAPSGGGKTTLANGILELIPNLSLSVSVTTRRPRGNDVEGREYFFKTVTEFNNYIRQNKFLEYAEIYGNYYGTLLEDVHNVLQENGDLLFDIDWQGAKSIKTLVTEYKVVTIFILPPSIEILKQRLTARGSDSPQIIEQRISLAFEEIKHAKDYDYIIINNDLNKSFEEIKSIIITERIKSSRTAILDNYQ